jgi:hypothetical protein
LNPGRISHFPRACYIYHPPLSPSCDHRNVWWGVQIIKFLLLGIFLFRRPFISRLLGPDNLHIRPVPYRRETRRRDLDKRVHMQRSRMVLADRYLYKLYKLRPWNILSYSGHKTFWAVNVQAEDWERVTSPEMGNLFLTIFFQNRLHTVPLCFSLKGVLTLWRRSSSK